METRKRRIFMVGYSTDKGGVETYIRNVCNFLKNDFDIIFHWPVMKIDGKEWRIPGNRHNPIKYIKFWRTFFKENKFDVIYYNTCDIVSIDLLKFAKDGRVPVRIIHSHSTGIQTERGGLIGLLHKFQEQASRKHLHLYATHLFACSASAGNWMFNGRDYLIIKNGISIPKYEYSENKLRSVASKLKINTHPVIACVGRLDTQKNPFFSLEIFREVCSLNTNAQCLFIGDGEHRAELEDMVSALSIKERIIFTGGIDNVNEWLSYVDCVVMPSLFEGLPFALVEAQAAGVHCLVSDTVSAESNITGLVKFKSLNDNPIDWAKAAIQLATVPRANLSAKLIEEGFSIQNTAETLKKLINQALHQYEVNISATK